MAGVAAELADSGKGLPPDAPVDDAPPPSMDSLVGLPSGLMEERAGNLKRKIATTSSLNDLYARRTEQDRSELKRAYDATAIQPGELQPWDQDKAYEKYKTDPLESFGSLGSVFAMVASAFTKAPMTNALNAGAAAMNAIKDGKDQEYERAFKAFKENTDLTMKRHSIMQQRYADADKFLNTDLHTWRAMTAAAAGEFDDQQTLTLLNAGMDKDVIELIHKRNVTAKDQVELGQSITKATFQQRALDGAMKTNDAIESPIERAAHNLNAFNRIYGAKQTPVQEIMGQWYAEHPNGTAEEAAKFYHETAMRSTAANQQFENLKIYETAVREEHPDWNEMQVRDEAQRRITRARTASNNNQKADERRDVEAGIRKEHPDWANDKVQLEVNKRIKASETVLTANERLKQEGLSDKYKYAIQTIDKIVEPVTKKLGPVGLPGYATRLGERLGNFVGSKSTDYVQISRNIDMLKIWAGQNLLGRDGKPLSAEYAHINNVIAGLSMGDTVANTLRSYKELKTLYEQMQSDVNKRMNDKWEAPGTAGTAESSATPTNKKPSWQNFPKVE